MIVSSQKFSWKIKVILVLITLLLLFGFLRQIIAGVPLGDHPMSSLTFFVFCCFVLFFDFLFFIVKFEFKTDEKNIQYRWFPINRNFYEIPCSEIKEVKSISTGLVGWGYRISEKYGVMHLAKGRSGLQVTLKNGKKYLFGVEDAAKTQIYIQSLM